MGFGTAMVDAIARVPDEFLGTVRGAKGGTVKISEDEMQDILRRLPEPPSRIPGGAAANTLAGVARILGRGSAALLAMTGEDDNGRFYLDFMEHEGLDTSRCVSTDRAPTGVCLSLVTQDAERTMRSFTGANDLVTKDTFSSDAFTGFDHFIIEGYTFRDSDVGDHLVKLADDAGLVVGLDFNAQEIVREHRERFRNLLSRHVTCVFANEQEAFAFGETDSPEDALKALSECCPIAVVKLGARGSLIQERGKPCLVIPAVQADAIDTTGAGDLWAAGFYAAWISGKSLETAGAVGSLVASEIVKTVGAHLSDAAWAQLKRRICDI